MSHHSTPHLHNKNTPGGLGADNGPSLSTSTNKAPIDSNTSISDSQAINAKQLLNAYVYDFLVKSRLPQTAKIFVNEAEVPSIQNNSANSNNNSPLQMNTGNATKPQGPNSTSNNSPHTPSGNSQQFQRENNLPCLALAMEAPQGFLYEWWQVFWDVLQAKNNKGGSQSAAQYYQSQMLKQRQQQDIQGLNIQPNMFGPVNGQLQQQMQQQQQKPSMDQQQAPQQFNPQQQQQLDQQQQQRYMMQMMMKQQMPMSGNPVDPQQQQMFGNMPPNNNLTLQQRMFITQQQQQQSQNRMQQHAQNQMNNLRQQAAATQQQPPAPGQQTSQDISSHSSPSNIPRMNSQIMPQVQHPQQPNNVQPFQQPQQPMINGNGQAQTTFNQTHLPMGIRMNSNGKPAAPGPQGDNMLMPNPNANDNGTPTNRNMNALQDYQMQLMLLEKQNKKRLDITRNNGNADPNGLMALNTGIMPPQAQLQPTNFQNQAQNPSPAGIVNSPVVNNKPSPTAGTAAAAAAAGAKRKKDPPAKRGRKSSATSVPTNPKAASIVNVNNSAANATNNNTTNSNSSIAFKKEYPVPLTPASESANDTVSKRKRRSTSTAESPNKQSVTKSSANKENPIPEEPSKTKKNEEILPSGSSSSFQDPSNDQIFPVEILGGNNNNDNHLFGAPMNNGGLDDIDFDFNQFLDGSGDNTLNDGMSAFNWGNVDAIENGE